MAQTYSEALAEVATLQDRINTLVETWSGKAASINNTAVVKCDPTSGKIVVRGRDMATGKICDIGFTHAEAEALKQFLTDQGI